VGTAAPFDERIGAAASMSDEHWARSDARCQGRFAAMVGGEPSERGPDFRRRLTLPSGVLRGVVDFADVGEPSEFGWKGRRC